MEANISYDNAPTNKSMQVIHVIPTIHFNRTCADVMTNTPHFTDIEGVRTWACISPVTM